MHIVYIDIQLRTEHYILSSPSSNKGEKYLTFAFPSTSNGSIPIMVQQSYTVMIHDNGLTNLIIQRMFI